METFFRVVGRIFIVGYLPFLYSCTLNDDNPPATKTFNATVKINEPKAITSSSLNIPDIEGFLTVDKNTNRDNITFHIRDGRIAPISMNLSEGIHTFKVEFDIHNTPYGVVRLLSSTPIALLVNAESANNLLILDNYLQLDADQDDVASLEELDLSIKLDQAYNPYDSASTPPLNPIRISKKLLHFSDPIEQGMTINWKDAKHKIPGTRIEYQLVFSAEDNLNTIEQFSAKPIYKTWSTDTFAIVENIRAAHNAYWNVVARDTENNQNIYASALPNGMGLLDRSLNSDGFLNLIDPQKQIRGKGIGITLDSLDNIVVVGSVNTTATTSNIAVWRLRDSGESVPTFGDAQGMISYLNPLGYISDDVANAVTLNPDENKILLVGQSGASNMSGDRNMILYQLFINGELDKRFGNGQGYVTSGSNKGAALSEIGNAITFDNFGRILVTGTAQKNPLKRVIVVWRYDAFGKPDTEFGSGKGYTTHNGLGGDINSPLSTATAIAVDAFDNIIVAGSTMNNSGNTDMALWKFDDSGEIIKNFGNFNGFVVHNNAAGGDLNDAGYDLALDKLNRIIVTGMSQTSATSQAMVVWRYLSNGQPDTSFAKNKHYITHTIPTGNATLDTGNSIAIDGHGNIVVGGSSYSDNNYVDSVIWRFAPKNNGIPDSTFASGTGYVIHNNATKTNPLSNDFSQSLVINSRGKYILLGTSDDINSEPNPIIWQYQ